MNRLLISQRFGGSLFRCFAQLHRSSFRSANFPTAILPTSTLNPFVSFRTNSSIAPRPMYNENLDSDWMQSFNLLNKFSAESKLPEGEGASATPGDGAGGAPSEDAPKSSETSYLSEGSEDEDFEKGRQLLPKEVVSELDRYIVGQDEAKRAVAIALRNRWRRRQLSSELRHEVLPKNILMIGPTGVGKTEIARRLAKLAQAPFLKVEATKFTEVGFHGRDVDQIIRDLVDVGIQQAKKLMRKKLRKKIEKEAEDKLLDLLTGEESRGVTRENFRKMLRSGMLDSREVEIEITPEQRGGGFEGGPQVEIHNFIKLINQSSRSRKARMTVKEAIPYIIKQEGEKMINQEILTKEAIDAVEQDGIVFIDEIDKICNPAGSQVSHADASAEGVQRDLLPLIEGSIISTKYGNVDTSKILFIASGAFYSCKPSDLLAELQGRLPIRVELKPLDEKALFRILTEPEYNLIKQQQALMKTEGIDLTFTEDAIREVSKLAAEVNESVENIGARRLHTVIEKIVEDVSFNCDSHSGQTVVIDGKQVQDRLQPMLKKADLSKFVL